jgi:hypothetical protein
VESGVLPSLPAERLGQGKVDVEGVPADRPYQMVWMTIAL